MIRSGTDVESGFIEKADVCIVGSGAGGAVAASVFAARGQSVVVLEEGPHVTPAQMNQREETMYPLLYRDGGNQTTSDGGVAVLQGRVVGGSTVINMADVVEIPDGVLTHWAEKFGVDRFDLDAVRAADRKNREAIGANLVEASAVNRNGSLLLEGGERIGVHGGVFEHNRVACRGSGYCLVGCTYEAKRSADLTFLAAALATGKTLVQAEARVERLIVNGRRIESAVGHVVRTRDAAPVAPFRVEARHFVLAAGAIHSPLLLIASDLGGKVVGRNLSLQPQVPAAALLREPVILWRGVPQAAYLDGFERCNSEEGLAGFRLEAVSGTPGMSGASIGLWGAELRAFMRALPRTAACLCLVPDRPNGRVRRDRTGRPSIEYALTPEVMATMKDAMRTAARVYFAARAEKVVLPGLPVLERESDLLALDALAIRSADIPLISAHPQGTCRMGKDPHTSVVDTGFFVHGVDNLQVLDASVFPTTSSSHTMLPVMTIARMGAEAAT